MPKGVKNIKTEDQNLVEEVKVEAVEVPTDPVVDTPKEDVGTDAVDEYAPEEKTVEKKGTPVIFHSIDGRKLEVSIGSFYVKGVKIEVPRDLADEVERVLKSGGYLVSKVA